MKILGIASVIFILLFSCAETINTSQGDSVYLIKIIDSVNNWYTIYATKSDSSYKIVVKKEASKSLQYKKMITVGQSYKLVLYSRKNNPPEINGIKIQPINALDVQCYTYDDVTNICIETKKGIYDLYHTPNIRGLCYIE